MSKSRSSLSRSCLYVIEEEAGMDSIIRCNQKIQGKGGSWRSVRLLSFAGAFYSSFFSSLFCPALLWEIISFITFISFCIGISSGCLEHCFTRMGWDGMGWNENPQLSTGLRWISFQGWKGAIKNLFHALGTTVKPSFLGKSNIFGSRYEWMVLALSQ